MFRLLLSIFLVFWVFTAVAQAGPEPHARLGLVLVWGHPVARVGLEGRLAFAGDFWQAVRKARLAWVVGVDPLGVY